jgi:uncharacterized protein YggU (UPF0235/DUF167 family)
VTDAAPLRLHVRAKVGSRRTGLSRTGNTVIVRVSKPAIDGAANEAIRRSVAAWLRVALAGVTIERGASSRYKVLAISGLGAGDLAAAIDALPLED